MPVNVAMHKTHCGHAKPSVHFMGRDAYLRVIEMIEHEWRNFHEPDPRFPQLAYVQRNRA